VKVQAVRLSRRGFGRRVLAIGVSALGVTVWGGCDSGRSKSSRVYRVGFLSGNFTATATPNIGIMAEVLRDHGYVLGQNLVMERRITEGRVDELAAAAAELVKLPVDVLIAEATPAARSAKDAARGVPVVFALVNDPVGQGLVASLDRPGANVTGVSTLSAAISGKRVELLKETVPGLARVAVFWNASNPGQVPVYTETEDAARALGVQAFSMPIHSQDELDAAVHNAAAARPDALLVLPAFIWNASQIAALAARQRIPIMMSDRTLSATYGALMSFGPDYPALFRRAADQVAKILGGTHPKDLPVEQPTTFDFTANQATARTLGITFPPGVAGLVTEWAE
jgi:putative ABC transport system substrate-binding protein